MPDLLGYGRSEQPTDFSYSVRDEAAVVVGFMDALASSRSSSAAGPWADGSCS
jgi:pimeloyl-ACP methyl ester carboxylesterase